MAKQKPALERAAKLIGKKQFGEAKVLLREALQAGESNPELLYDTLASVHSLEGEPEKQIAVLEEGIAALPEDVGLKVNLAKALLTQGKDPTRIRSLLASAKIPSGDPWEKLAQQIVARLDRKASR